MGLGTATKGQERGKRKSLSRKAAMWTLDVVRDWTCVEMGRESWVTQGVSDL